MKNRSLFYNTKYFLKSLLPENICLNIKRQNMRDYYRIQAFKDKEYGLAKVKGESRIIVSLTTYGTRIFDVPLVIQSLFEQTQKADKIILWLSEDEFSQKKIPTLLDNMCKRGLEIRFCEELRSYKKLLPTLRQYPDDVIITVDDDILYPYDLIEYLYKTYLAYPEDVIFNYGNKISFKEDKVLLEYDDWSYVGNDGISSDFYFGIGVGGILYPPSTFNDEVFDYDKIKALAPYADDIWFKMMAAKNGKKYRHSWQPICKPETFLKKFLTLEDNQKESLGEINVIEKKNDIQMKQVIDYYNLWDIFK